MSMIYCLNWLMLFSDCNDDGGIEFHDIEPLDLISV